MGRDARLVVSVAKHHTYKLKDANGMSFTDLIEK